MTGGLDSFAMNIAWYQSEMVWLRPETEPIVNQTFLGPGLTRLANATQA